MFVNTSNLNAIIFICIHLRFTIQKKIALGSNHKVEKEIVAISFENILCDCEKKELNSWNVY